MSRGFSTLRIAGLISADGHLDRFYFLTIELRVLVNTVLKASNTRFRFCEVCTECLAFFDSAWEVPR